MSMNIYVGNLPYSMTEDDLRDMFAEYGEVKSVQIIADKFSGRSKGFGFVEMTDKAGGEAAIEALDGYEAGGRELRVNEARPRTERSERGGGERGGREGGRGDWGGGGERGGRGGGRGDWGGERGGGRRGGGRPGGGESRF